MHVGDVLADTGHSLEASILVLRKDAIPIQYSRSSEGEVGEKPPFRNQKSKADIQEELDRKRQEELDKRKMQHIVRENEC